jgi:3-phenylpropionate/trans-cinnamate dioxygenase ferredoxin component
VSFQRACSLDDLRDGAALGVTVDDQELAIAHDGDEVFAVEDICSHAAVALSEGDVEGCTVECWLHGSRFDLRTGKPTGLPATEPVSTFPVELRANPDGTSDVYVDVTTTLNGVTPQ